MSSGASLCWADSQVYAVHKRIRPDLMENTNSHWLTAKEAAGYLKVEPRTVLQWVRQGKLKGFTLSGTKRHVWRFQHVDLDAMLTLPSVASNGRIQ
jgi:excisionase family DNA binding protein